MTAATPNSMVDVVILSWDRESTSDRRAREIASWLGAETQNVVLGAAPTDITSIRALVPPCRCLVVDAETFAKLAESLILESRGLASMIDGLAAHLFVHGFQPTIRHSAVLRAVSLDALASARRHADGAAAFKVIGAREWCGQFSGIQVIGANP